MNAADVPVELAIRINADQRKLPNWRWEALRTTFWLVPTGLIVVATLFFVVTFEIDLAGFHHHLTLPYWIRTGSADAAARCSSPSLPRSSQWSAWCSPSPSSP
jgi:uncharacterized membrane protein